MILKNTICFLTFFPHLLHRQSLVYNVVFLSQKIVFLIKASTWNMAAEENHYSTCCVKIPRNCLKHFSFILSSSYINWDSPFSCPFFCLCLPICLSVFCLHLFKIISVLWTVSPCFSWICLQDWFRNRQNHMIHIDMTYNKLKKNTLSQIDCDALMHIVLSL